MLDAWRTDDESALSQQERSALDEAEAIVERLQARYSSSLELERAIFDELCARLAFNEMLEKEPGEDALGVSAAFALTHGWANCQGYSDAFYLLAGMAGFEVGFQNGYNAGVLHAWNTVELGGQWYVVTSPQRMLQATWSRRKSAFTRCLTQAATVARVLFPGIRLGNRGYRGRFGRQLLLSRGNSGFGATFDDLDAMAQYCYNKRAYDGERDIWVLLLGYGEELPIDGINAAMTRVTNQHSGATQWRFWGWPTGGSAVHTAALGCFLTISNGEDNAGVYDEKMDDAAGLAAGNGVLLSRRSGRAGSRESTGDNGGGQLVSHVYEPGDIASGLLAQAFGQEHGTMIVAEVRGEGIPLEAEMPDLVLRLGAGLQQQGARLELGLRESQENVGFDIVLDADAQGLAIASDLLPDERYTMNWETLLGMNLEEMTAGLLGTLEMQTAQTAAAISALEPLMEPYVAIVDEFMQELAVKEFYDVPEEYGFPAVAYEIYITCTHAQAAELLTRLADQLEGDGQLAPVLGRDARLAGAGICRDCGNDAWRSRVACAVRRPFRTGRRDEL